MSKPKVSGKATQTTSTDKTKPTNSGASHDGKDATTKPGGHASDKIAAPTDEHSESGETPVALSDARIAHLTNEAAAFAETPVVFPGRAKLRLKHLTRMAQAAQHDASDLIRTPFHGEPKLTNGEVTAFGEQVEFLRWTISHQRSLKGSREQATERFEQMAPVARQHIKKLLGALDLRYRQDPAGRKRVSAIRAGEGDADLVQDVSDVLHECQLHEAYLASCPRGESESLAWLKQNFADLSQLLASKGGSNVAVDARRLRDVAYTLASQTERRLRTAAGYWYDDPSRFAPYAAFVAPTTGASDEEEESAPGDDTKKPA